MQIKNRLLINNDFWRFLECYILNEEQYEMPLLIQNPKSKSLSECLIAMCLINMIYVIDSRHSKIYKY